MVTGSVDTRIVPEYSDRLCQYQNSSGIFVTGCVDSRIVLEYGDRLCRYQDSSGI